eukprot:PITA_16952
MQWVARNPLSLNRRNSSKSMETAHPPRMDVQYNQNGKMAQKVSSFSETNANQQMQHDDQKGGGNSSEETLVRIPGRAVVHLVEAGEEDSVQLGSGEFSIVRLVQGNTGIALFVKVGEEVRWPLAKDEPTLKIDSRHYVFSIRPPPDEEANDEDKEKDKESSEVLNYGVTFAGEEGLDLLDSCLRQHACFAVPPESTGGVPKATRSAKNGSCEGENTEGAYWSALAPKVEDYNSVVAKAIASGSGQIIKGIFFCTNAYASQVQKGGEFVRSRLTKSESKTAAASDHEKKKNTDIKISSRTKRNIRRVKKLSKMTEELSGNVLAGVAIVSSAVTAPVLGSEASQKFCRMLPREVLLASLDAINKVLEAAEAAGKDALSAASDATVDVVTQRFGDDAGEATHDTFEVAGHVIGTAWNVTKVRKAINPATNGTLSASAMKLLNLKNASKAITTASK